MLEPWAFMLLRLFLADFCINEELNVIRFTFMLVINVHSNKYVCCEYIVLPLQQCARTLNNIWYF